MKTHLNEKYVMTTGIDLDLMFDAAEQALGNRRFGFHCEQSTFDIIEFDNISGMTAFILVYGEHSDIIDKDYENFEVRIKADSSLSKALQSIKLQMNIQAEVVSKFRISLPAAEDYVNYYAILNNTPNGQAVFFDG
jgi:hypothetical protein